MAEGLASVPQGSGIFPWAQNELPPWLLPSPWMPKMVPPWATLALQRDQHRVHIPTTARWSTEPLEAAEGEGTRPWSLPRGQNFGEVLDKEGEQGVGRQRPQLQD